VPSIKISDQFNAEILSATAGPGSGISKYFKGDAAGFLASSELITAQNKSIATLPDSPAGLGFNFKDSGSFGATGKDWTLAAGAKVTVQATQAGGMIPGDDLFAAPLQVAAGTTVVTITFTPSLSVGVTAGSGDLQFGFTAGGSVAFRSARTYEVTGANAPVLRKALTDMLTTGIVPGDLADLRMMKPGDISSVSGSGELKASASFDLAAALNPLTTPTLGLQQIGSLQLKAGASLTVGASVGIKGRYQVRVIKMDASRVRIGYYRMKGSQFDVSVTAKAGVTATLANKELIELLMKISSDPKANVQAMVEEGLSDDQIDGLKGAISASVDRSLSLSLAASFSAASENSAAFEYEFDLDALDIAGTDALHAALDADLSALTSTESTGLPAGVKLIKSQFTKFKEQKATWKINLLGIVNVLHVTDLISQGKTLFDAETGELLITDTVTGSNLTISSRPLEADTQKLRKVMMQSMVMTSAYRASGVQKFLNFDCSMSYYEQLANINKPNVSNFLDNFIGLQLIDDAGKQAFLNSSFAGRGSMFLELTFDNSAFEAMFIDAAGKPFSQEVYDGFGRQCIADLVQPGDDNEFRRVPMIPANDELWKQMTELGQFSMRSALPAALQQSVPLGLIVHDYTVIRWWSSAMHGAAQQVVAMKQFLEDNGDDAEALKGNKDFKKTLAALDGALANVVKNAQPDFLDAWGLLAMDRAAGRNAAARGILVTTSSVLVKDRV
jgi:hypothetical protein